MPDRATTVVSTPPGETIRSLVSRLLDKRGLRFTSFDAFVTGQERPLDLSEDCATLGCSEVRVEPRVLFRLELPSKKSIGVKAKQTKLVEEVLGPILAQYGWRLEDMLVRLEVSGNRRVMEAVELGASVTSIDNSRLVVSSGQGDSSVASESSAGSRPPSRTSNARQSSSSLDSRREELLMPPPRTVPSHRTGRQSQAPVTATEPGPGHQQSESTLYEGLKRMTKGRLDDQRGLEINTELPDFLKTRQGRASEPCSREGGAGGRGGAGPAANTRLSGPAELWDREHARHYIDYLDSTFTSEGVVPSLAQAEEIFPPPNPDESLNFNESRLSLGLHRLSVGGPGHPYIEGMRVVSR